jgi:hypothetical protein
MNINRDNYEIWAVDYLDGNLSTSDAALFMAFLAENTDLADELDALRDNIIAIDNELIVPDFSFFKKGLSEADINEQSFEEFCIAYHEGDLTIDKQKELLRFIANNTYRKQVFEAYAKLKIVPNKSLTFKGKSLYKQHKSAFHWSGSKIVKIASLIAASVALVIVLYNNKLDSINLYNALSSSSGSSVLSEINTQTQVESKIADKQTAAFAMKWQIKEVIVQDTTGKHFEGSSAAVDTNNWENAFIKISRIEINSIRSGENESMLSLLNSTQSADNKIDKTIAGTAFNRFMYRTELIALKAQNITLDQIFKKGVEGLNQVAEADLQYHSETDSEGRIIAFALSSERINIKHIIRNN